MVLPVYGGTGSPNAITRKSLCTGTILEARKYKIIYQRVYCVKVIMYIPKLVS